MFSTFFWDFFFDSLFQKVLFNFQTVEDFLFLVIEF